MNDVVINAELTRLGTLRSKYSEVQSEILSKRADVQRCSRELSEARVSHLVDPETYNAKTTEARVKKLERDMADVEPQLQKLTAESQALSAAIERLEAEVLPKRHAERLAAQAEIQKRYRAVAVKIRDAATALRDACEEARAIYIPTQGEFPKNAAMAGQGTVLHAAGLQQIWDYAFVDSGQPNRRDYIVGRIWDFDRSLIDPSDPVALAKTHQENHFAKVSRDAEAERLARLNPARPAEDQVPSRARSLSERFSGELMPDNATIRVSVRR